MHHGTGFLPGYIPLYHKKLTNISKKCHSLWENVDRLPEFCTWKGEFSNSPSTFYDIPLFLFFLKLSFWTLVFLTLKDLVSPLIIDLWYDWKLDGKLVFSQKFSFFRLTCYFSKTFFKHCVIILFSFLTGKKIILNYRKLFEILKNHFLQSKFHFDLFIYLNENSAFFADYSTLVICCLTNVQRPIRNEKL